MIVPKVRNVLVGAGAYYLSWWVAGPLEFAYGKLTEGIIYSGDFAGTVVMPLVTQVPVALVAAVVGASVAWLVESDKPVRWAILPALLYAFFGIEYHWARPPTLLDRVREVITALFPAGACVVGGILAARRRSAGRGSSPRSGTSQAAL